MQAHKSKEEIQQMFNVFDKDGNGSIEKEEIKTIAQELGLNWNPNKLNKIMAVLDSNNDGKISFEEFYEYFQYGVQKQMDKLIYLKFAHIKEVKNFKKKLSTTYEHVFDQDIQDGKSTHTVEANIGEVKDAKTQLDTYLRIGQESKHYAQSVLKHFPYVDDSNVQFVISLKCNNSDVVRDKLAAFIEESIDLAITMVPEEYMAAIGDVKEQLKIDYKALPDEVLIRFYFQHELITTTLEEYKTISNMFITDQTSLNLHLSLQFLNSLTDLSAAPGENILNIITKGLKILARMEISAGLLATGRAVYAQTLKSLEGTNRAKEMAAFLPLILTENTRLEFNFDSFNQFVQELGIPDVANLQIAAQQAKDININELVSNLPFVADFLDVIRTECSSTFYFSIIDNQASFTLSGKTEGTADVWEKLI